MKPKRIEECGCCEVGIPPTPAKIKNRPGLAQLSYRVGTYAGFRQAMIEAIAKSPELRAWTARQSDDYGIALIEMWAYLADILTFYQERVANEAFLRTALHRDTIMRLAEMLDYKLNPGVAAGTYLTFFAEDDARVNIPVGLRVQSVPGQDEKPQKFETVEAVLAEDKLNQIRVLPKPQFYNPFAQDSLGGILISDSEKVSPGDKIVVFDATRAEFKEISDLSVRDDQQILSWFPEIGGSKFQQFSTRVFPYGQKFQLYGYNAPEYYMEPSTGSDGTIQWTLKKVPNDYDFSLPTPTPSTFSLDAVYGNLKSNSKLLLVGSGSGGDDLFTRIATIKEVTTTPDQLGPLQDTVTQVSLDMQLSVTPVVVLDHLNHVQVFTIGDDGALWTIRQSAPNDGWEGWVSLGGQINMLVVGKNEDGRLEVFARGMNKALWHIWQLSPGGDWSQWASLGGQIDMLAVGNNEDGRLEVFARGMNKALWHIWQVAPNDGWSGWASLGGQIDMLAVGNNEDGRLEVFARGMNKALWHIWQVAPNDGWSGWASLSGQIDMLAVGNNEDGRLEVFARGMDKALWHIWQVAPNDGWSGWASLSGQIDMLAVGNNEDGRLEVFARGTDKALWHIWQVAPNDGWSGWASLGGQIDMIAVGHSKDGRLEVLVRGIDKALWHIGQVSPNSRWSSPVSLDGRIDILAIGRNKDGRLEVFARGMDNSLWHIWQTSPNNGWSSWVSLGGQIDMLTVGNNKDGRLEVFARGMDNALWHIWQTSANNGWSSWASLGGQIDMLTVGNNEDGRLEVFARGMDNSLWHIWQTSPNNGWSSWASLGGQIDMLTVGNNEDGRLEVFARGMDNSLWHIWQTLPNNGWSSWASLGGQIDMLMVGNNKDGRLEIFARSTDKELWHIWQVASNNGWSDWEKLGDQKLDMLTVGHNKDGRLEVFARGMDNALWHLWQVVPNSSWKGWNSLGIPIWRIPDIRKILIYELTGAAIEFWNRYYPDSISGNTVYAKLDQVEKIDKDRVLIIDDKNTKSEVVTVTLANPVDTDGDGEKDHLAITFTPALTRSFDFLSAKIFGNITKATHGESVSGEILGNGDASQKFQEFTLKKSPTTFVPSTTAPTGAQNTLEVRIGGVLWKEARSLYGQNADDEIYITRVDDEAKMTVRFGDGETGARLPTGQDNAVAKYRRGLGSEGNVAANSITTLLQRPTGLKTVTNPEKAKGGTDPESLQKARQNAPNTVRTFERAISLRDYEDLARSYTGIAKARAVKVFKNENEMIQLTIAGEKGQRIEVNSLTYENFLGFLDLHRDINHLLEVVPHSHKYLTLKTTIQVDPAYLTGDVIAAIKKALLKFFDFNNLQLGQGIHLSDIYAVIQAVDGVTAALIDYLDYKASGSPSLNVHLLIVPDHIAALNEADLKILSDLT